MAYFEATTSFDSALSEVEHLIRLAELCEKRRHEYSTYLKAALVLLGAKFEAFAENIIENYVDRLTELKPQAKHLPRELRLHSTTILLNQSTSNLSFSGKSTAISNLQLAAALWNEDYVQESLKVSNKFNYGKHGSSELRSLFQRIGFNDILNECKISTLISDTMLGTEIFKVSIDANVDSFTNIRNNIIHSDASPNITHQEIHDFKEKLWEFGYTVDLRLEHELLKIQQAILSSLKRALPY